MLRQDDPFKCTAAKLVKFRLAEQIRSIGKHTIMLNPFSHAPVLRKDSQIADSVCAIDCSWEKADDVLKQQRMVARGIGRRMPALLAANPVNYSKLGKLSSAEALAGALYILGEYGVATEMMNKFKWGHTFLELNSELLREYSSADTAEEVAIIERRYFPQLG